MVILIGLVALVAVVSATTLAISELRKNTATIYSVSQYEIAYGAIENAFMQLLRNPNYSGETVTLSGSTCTITVTGSASSKTVISRCTNGTYARKVGATVTFTSGLMSVSNILEQE